MEIYQNTYDINNKLEWQFVLSMQAQIRRCAGAAPNELKDIFQEAVDLTMPGAEKKPLCDLVLSIKELNLLLELEQYREGGQRQERYLEIMDYLEKHFDRIGKSKLYPKAVYLLCQCDKINTPKTLLSYCDTALEYLRDASRMYYLWEILELRNVLLKTRIDRLGRNYPQKRDELLSSRKDNNDWKEALEKVYEKFHVRKDTFEYCYLYVLKGVYCINDVIRIRRKMLNMSQRELRDEDKDIKTVSRIENRKESPQQATLNTIFGNLSLSIEYTKTNVETENPEVKQQMELLLKQINNLQWEEAEKLLKKIREQVSVENRYNLQVLMKEDAYIKWKTGVIDTSDYYNRMREALELTLPLKSFLSEGEKYLTHMEQTCIQNLMQGMDKTSEEFITCMRRFEEYYQPYVEKGLLQAVSGMHDFIMSYVASEMGNRGEFDMSDRHFSIIIEGSLRFRRLRLLPHSLYNGWWNNSERKNRGIPVNRVLSLNDADELEQVVVLSELAKQNKRKQFYQKKLNQVLQSI